MHLTFHAARLDCEQIPWHARWTKQAHVCPVSQALCRTLYFFFFICHKAPICIMFAWSCYLWMASHDCCLCAVRANACTSRLLVSIPRRTCRCQSWRSWLTWFGNHRVSTLRVGNHPSEWWEVFYKELRLDELILFYSNFKTSSWLAAKSWRGWSFSYSYKLLWTHWYLISRVLGKVFNPLWVRVS